jgi:hypothetical protein
MHFQALFLFFLALPVLIVWNVIGLLCGWSYPDPNHRGFRDTADPIQRRYEDALNWPPKRSPDELNRLYAKMDRVRCRWEARRRRSQAVRRLLGIS